MLNVENDYSAQSYKNSQILDEEGFLINSNDWDRSFTEARAREAQIELQDKHWLLINLIRDKYLRLGAIPPMRTACKAAGINKLELIRRFGNCLALWKLAGLPNPGEEAKAYMN